jgi:hypothetical protein
LHDPKRPAPRQFDPIENWNFGLLSARAGFLFAHFETVLRSMNQCVNLDLFAPAPVATPDPDPAPSAAPPSPTLLDQLDLFLHSDVEQAAARARRALRQLSLDQVRVEIAYMRAHSSSLDGFARDLERCIEAIERRDPRWRDTGAAVAWIECELRPAATRALADHADVPVRIALRSLLAQAQVTPYRGETAHAHRSYLHHRLGEHEQAIAALVLDPAWRSNEPALRWHVELCRACNDHAAELADIAELCYEFPDSVEKEISAALSLATHWDEFCDTDPGMPVYAFPAWCRLLHAVPFVRAGDSDTRPGAALLATVAALTSSAGADLAIRKSMHRQAPQLLSAWLTRSR